MAVVVGPLAGAVSAGQPSPGEDADAYMNTAGDPTAMASDTDIAPGGGGSSGSGSSNVTCTWQARNESDGFLVYHTEGVQERSPTGRWFVRICRDNTTGAVEQAVIPEAAPVDPVVLAQQALQSVAIPDPVIYTSPSADRGLVVRVPTWLWVDSRWWRPYTATATAGSVTATVTALPTSAVWGTGDGSSVTCGGPGTPWAAGLPEDAADCVHTYLSSSDTVPGGSFELGVTVELDVSWTSTVGASGTLGPISRAASRPVRVGEIQAIETR